MRHHGCLPATRANLLGGNDEVGADIFAEFLWAGRKDLHLGWVSEQTICSEGADFLFILPSAQNSYVLPTRKTSHRY